MNKTFSLISSRLDGEMRVSFNEVGLLVKFEAIGDVGNQQLQGMLNVLPLRETMLDDIKRKWPTLIVKEVQEEITFEMFWKRYNDSDRSSKKKSLARWNKFDVANQRKAYYFYPKYIRAIPPGVEKKYCETYLNAELWNN